jgi:hypothetical protein
MRLFFISKFCTLVGVFVFYKPLWAAWPLQDFRTFEQWVEGPKSFQKKFNEGPSEKELENKKDSGFSKNSLNTQRNMLTKWWICHSFKGLGKKT